MKSSLSCCALAFVFWPLISCANTAAENNQTPARPVAEKPVKKRMLSGAAAPSASNSRMSGSSTSSTTSNPTARQMDADYLRGRVDQCMQMLPTEKMCQNQIMIECHKEMSAADCQAQMNQYRSPGM